MIRMNKDNGGSPLSTTPGMDSGKDAEIAPYCDCQKYDLCEFYYFRRPKVKPGFLPAQGGLLENAADLYPEAWAYLQTEDGRMLCATEEEWQAMSRAVWATLADGTKVGWNGIGGVPFYAPDYVVGTLRLPDLRGMYPECAGFDGLEIGGTHGDTIRDMAGNIHFNGAQQAIPTPMGTGTFAANSVVNGNRPNSIGALSGAQGVDFAARRVVPTGNKVAPRAWGALGCVYLGVAG